MVSPLIPLSLVLASMAFSFSVLVYRKFHGTPFGKALVGLVLAIFFLIPYFVFKIIEINFNLYGMETSVYELFEVPIVFSALATVISFVKLFVKG